MPRWKEEKVFREARGIWGVMHGAGMNSTGKVSSARTILADGEKSSYRKYKDLTTGDTSFLRFLFYEIVTLFLVPLPGAIGILLRRIVYKWFFKRCGTDLIVGRNCIFRHPSKIVVENNVTIDDNCLIDARGTEEKGIVLDNGVMINRNTSIQSKCGDILVGKAVSIGAGSSLVSWSGIQIGDGSMLAGGCHLSAGTFDYTEVNKSMQEQEAYSVGPIVLGKNIWITTGVTILDGVRIGNDSIISAGSVVTGNIPPESVASGNPAKVVFKRR